MKRSDALEGLRTQCLRLLDIGKLNPGTLTDAFERRLLDVGMALSQVELSDDDRRDDRRPALILNRLKPPSSRLNWFPFVEYGDRSEFTSYERLVQRDSSRGCVWVAPWWIAWFYRLIPGIWWSFDPEEDGKGENGFVNWAIAWPHGLQVVYVSGARWPGKGPYLAFSWVARDIRDYRRLEISLPW